MSLQFINASPKKFLLPMFSKAWKVYLYSTIYRAVLSEKKG